MITRSYAKTNNAVSLRAQLSTLRTFVRFCQRIDAVEVVVCRVSATPYDAYISSAVQYYTLDNMSIETAESNVAVVEGMYESFAEGDMEGVVATWNDDIELHEPEGAVVGGTYHGPNEIVEILTTIAGMYEEMSAVPERYVNSGETVVALGTASGTSAETGKSVEFPFAHVYDLEDGKISRWTSYIDTALFNAAHEE